MVSSRTIVQIYAVILFHVVLHGLKSLIGLNGLIELNDKWPNDMIRASNKKLWDHKLLRINCV